MGTSSLKKVYFIGIKGVGMTALAQILKSGGAAVVGSDVADVFLTDKVLKREGIKVFEGFSKENLAQEKADLIVYSTAYNSGNNEEFRYGEDLGYPMVSYPDMVARLFNSSYGIAVCGSHGKTTTTAMLAAILLKAGYDPLAIIGSYVPQFEGNALVGASQYFVLEADEYQNKFLKYEPKAVIVTNIDWDHPDTFPTPDHYAEAFKKFLQKIPADGLAIGCAEDAYWQKIMPQLSCQVATFGINPAGDFHAERARMENRNGFKVFYQGNMLGEIELLLPGRHNVLNALAALSLGRTLGIDFGIIKNALEAFVGTERRLEYKGEFKVAAILDDYAHHPTEIRASLAALREQYPHKKIWCVFHPHTYTLTQALLSGFSKAFTDADEIIALEIYASARETKGSVSSADLVEMIKKHGKSAYFVPTIPSAAEFLRSRIGATDVVVTMGAGDVWKVGEQLLVK